MIVHYPSPCSDSPLPGPKMFCRCVSRHPPGNGSNGSQLRTHTGKVAKQEMVVSTASLFESLQRPPNGTAISLKFDTSHIDTFLEKLLSGQDLPAACLARM